LSICTFVVISMLTFLVQSYLRICELQGVSMCDYLFRVAISPNQYRSNQWMFMFSAIYQQCTSVQMYPCDTCDRRYRRIISLQRHKRLECGKEAQFECMMCHAKFKHKPTFTCSTVRSRTRRIPLDKQNDRDSRKNNGQIIDIFESLNSFQFKTQRRYKIISSSHMNNSK